MVPLDDAEGAILAHSVALPDRRLRKGMVLTGTDIAMLRGAGIAEVTVARLDPDDIAEDMAATRLARALVPGDQGLTLTEAFTGRINLKATGPGIVAMDVAAIHRLNRIHPAITLATLPPMTRVAKGTLTGTVKIIAYAVPDAALRKAETIAHAAIRIRPVTLLTASLLLTEVPGQEAKLTLKGKRAIESRVRALGITLVDTVVTAHDATAMAVAIAGLQGDFVMILTGSATSDLFDTAPQAVRLAGGTVARFGMPVDPGNLLFLGALHQRPVIGLPGCARSPALNGADWVLERIACGVAVTDDDIAQMGVGGLLKEISIRPQLRDPD